MCHLWTSDESRIFTPLSPGDGKCRQFRARRSTGRLVDSSAAATAAGNEENRLSCVMERRAVTGRRATTSAAAVVCWRQKHGKVLRKSASWMSAVRGDASGERVERLFELVTEEIEVSERLPKVKIVRPRSEDEVLEYYVARKSLESDPYWAALWPSALAVSKYVGNTPSVVKGRGVCDLGAGLGLAGLAACAAGASSVTFYDREPLAMQCALLSVEANGWGHLAKASVFDWNDVEKNQEKFDTLLACDVLYEEQAVAPVAELIPKLVKSGGGRFLLGDPPKRTPQNRARFSSLLVEQYGAFVMREWTAALEIEGDELVFIDFKL